MGILSSLFSKSAPQPLAQPIEAGQKWILKSEVTDGSPWPRKNLALPPVTILDAKEGWVRYRFGSAEHIFSDERMREEFFRAIYQPVE